MSEIEDDIDEVLMILHLLFGENRRLKKLNSGIYGWIGSIMVMLEYTNGFE